MPRLEPWHGYWQAVILLNNVLNAEVCDPPSAGTAQETLHSSTNAGFIHTLHIPKRR